MKWRRFRHKNVFATASWSGEPSGADIKRQAVDPVYEMLVDVTSARWTFEHEGTTYYFCAPGCQKAFSNDPAAFL